MLQEFDQTFQAFDSDRQSQLMEGGYGPASACPAVEHATFWLEIYQDDAIASRTDYVDAYYQD